MKPHIDFKTATGYYVISQYRGAPSWICAHPNLALVWREAMMILYPRMRP